MKRSQHSLSGYECAFLCPPWHPSVFLKILINFTRKESFWWLMHAYKSECHTCKYMPTSSQAHRQRWKILEVDTYCVITSVGVQFVVHRFNNSSSEGQEHHHVLEWFLSWDWSGSHRGGLEGDTKLTHLLASSPPGGRLGMDSDANVLITWTRSGTPSSPCFLIISGEKHYFYLLPMHWKTWFDGMFL